MTELSADKSNVIRLPFYIADAAASQTAVALSPPGEATATDVAEQPIPWKGSIVGLSVAVEAARTAGTLTLQPTINGTAHGDGVIIDDDPTQYNTVTYARGTYQFTAGQRIGMDMTTDASWAAGTTPSVVGCVFVHIEEQ